METDYGVFYPNARLPELGKIKIGGRGEKRKTAAGTEWFVPRKDDHFTITTLGRDPSGAFIPDTALMDKLKVKYADPDGHLRSIPIRVMSNDLNDILQAAYVWYGGKTVGARSDGHKVIWYCDRASGKRLPQPIEEPWKDEYLELKASRGTLFKKHTVLNCVIGEAGAKWGGVYKFRTTSVITGDQLYASLLHLSQLTGGILYGMPLVLVVRPIQVAPEGRATTVYVVHIELRGEELKEAMQVQALAANLAKYQLENAQTIKRDQGLYRKLLAAPGVEPDEEAADINMEFQPETVGEMPAAPAGAVDAKWQDILGGAAPVVVDAEVVDEEAPEPPPEPPPEPQTTVDAQVVDAPPQTRKELNAAIAAKCLALASGDSAAAQQVLEEQYRGLYGVELPRKNGSPQLSDEEASAVYEQLVGLLKANGGPDKEA